MSGVYQIPPGRDLPSGRLAQRREHLLAEIVRDRESDRAPAPMRLPWPRRRKVIALVAVTLLLVATACTFGVRALILDKGFIGLPPEGATPSTPESGELVLEYFGPDPYFTHPYFQPEPDPELANAATTSLWVYADGRLISHRNGDFVEGANRLSAGFLEQRLTAEGVELLRSEVVSTLLRPDQPSPDTQLPWFYIAVRDGDQFVKLLPDDDFSAHFPITPSDFERFVARLTHSESWLPASAWVERKVRAYVPARYAVCYGGGPAWAPIEPSRILSMLPAKAEELLAKAEELIAPGEHCGGLTTDAARAVAEALDDAGFEHPQFGSEYYLAYEFEIELPGAGRGSVYFEPMLPHGEWICSDCG